jgi:hypothetical protein
MSAAQRPQVSIRDYRPSNSFTKSACGATNDEHQRHLARAQCQPSYTGPVHTVETVYVPCGWCGTPVDPVSRVPVGRMFFHPHCLRCVICGKIGSRTLPFVARQGQPVCAHCDRNKTVSLPPLRASAFAARAQAAIDGVGTLRALMERSATRSPSRRGHALEMAQLAVYQRDPNILLISSERQHELDGTLQSQRRSAEQQAREAVSLRIQATAAAALAVEQQPQQQQIQQAPPTSGRRAVAAGSQPRALLTQRRASQQQQS